MKAPGVMKKRQGKGKMVYSSGDIYEGEWNNDVKEGYGVVKWLAGDKYEGTWSNEKKHGKGKMVYSTGDIYEGEWSNGVEDGYGIFKWRAGDKYEGTWSNEKNKGKARWFIVVATYMKVNGTMMSKKGMEYVNGRVETDTRVILRTIPVMVKEQCFIVRVMNMWGNG